MVQTAWKGRLDKCDPMAETDSKGTSISGTCGHLTSRKLKTETRSHSLGRICATIILDSVDSDKLDTFIKATKRKVAMVCSPYSPNI